MMHYKNRLFFPLFAFLVISLSGCAAMQTEFGKRDLDVQTRMTKTIFLEPVADSKRKIYVQAHNTSGKHCFNLQNRLRASLAAKGYQVVNNPEEAYFLVQANVLQVGKVNLREVNSAFESGFGGALLGATVAGIAGGNDRALLAAGLAGTVVGIAADAMVKDNLYTVITDVQLSERSKLVDELTVSNLPQGIHSRNLQASKKKGAWKKYQTRIISTANQANLKLEDAMPLLANELVSSISGLV